MHAFLILERFGNTFVYFQHSYSLSLREHWGNSKSISIFWMACLCTVNYMIVVTTTTIIILLCGSFYPETASINLP